VPVLRFTVRFYIGTIFRNSRFHCSVESMPNFSQFSYKTATLVSNFVLKIATLPSSVLFDARIAVQQNTPASFLLLFVNVEDSL